MQYDDKMFMTYEQLISNNNNNNNNNSNVNNSNCRNDFDQSANYQNFQNCIVSKCEVGMTINHCFVRPDVVLIR